MNANQIILANMLGALDSAWDYKLEPATNEAIDSFKAVAIEKGVDEVVINQLFDLYRVADNYNYEIILSFHSCVDIIVFEWWDEKELWLGQKDFYTLRWANEKFCLGDASNISFSDDYECDNLVSLIERCIKDIYEANYFDIRDEKGDEEENF